MRLVLQGVGSILLSHLVWRLLILPMKIRPLLYWRPPGYMSSSPLTSSCDILFCPVCAAHPSNETTASMEFPNFISRVTSLISLTTSGSFVSPTILFVLTPTLQSACWRTGPAIGFGFAASLYMPLYSDPNSLVEDCTLRISNEPVCQV